MANDGFDVLARADWQAFEAAVGVTVRARTRSVENLVSQYVRPLRGAGLADYRREGKLALCPLTERGRELLEVIVGQAVSS